MIPLSHLSFVQCRQEKFRPKKKVKLKVFHSVVMVGGGGGGAGKAAKHDMNFCYFFNLIIFTISNKA